MSTYNFDGVFSYCRFGLASLSTESSVLYPPLSTFEGSFPFDFTSIWLIFSDLKDFSATIENFVIYFAQVPTNSSNLFMIEIK